MTVPDNRTMLDDRIEKDLTELYNGGATPGNIKDALRLNGLIQAEDRQRSFATRALPQYYVGNRKAKTVMVMLNPGCGVVKANQSLKKNLEIRSMENAGDIENYHTGSENFGHKDKKRPDTFDVKQAFFLRHWKGSGITLPQNLYPKCDKDIKLDAKEAVLTQKLQLELIPYASRSINNLNRQKIDLLVPFVETLFDDIFSEDRKYIIFCSRLFEDVFKVYNKQHPDTVIFERIIPFDEMGKRSAKCSVITIHYKTHKPLKAIIAHTFPSRALSYRLMEIYGELCYKEYIKK